MPEIVSQLSAMCLSMLATDLVRLADPGNVTAKTTTERITCLGAMCCSMTSATAQSDSANTSGSRVISMRCSNWSRPTDMRVTLRTEIGETGCGVEAKICSAGNFGAPLYYYRMWETALGARQVSGKKSLWDY